jgi:hypothetical protein
VSLGVSESNDSFEQEHDATLFIALFIRAQSVELNHWRRLFGTKSPVHQRITIVVQARQLFHFVDNPDVSLESGLFLMSVTIKVTADALDFGMKVALVGSGRCARRCQVLQLLNET